MSDPKKPEQSPEPKTIKVAVICDTLIHSGEIYAKGSTVTDTEDALKSAIETEAVKKL